jgi:hypothetical protein
MLSGSTEVEHLTHIPKIEGLNPATCTFIENIAKKVEDKLAFSTTPKMILLNTTQLKQF